MKLELRIFYIRSEEHTSELQSQSNVVCRLLLEKKKRLLAELRVGLAQLALRLHVGDALLGLCGRLLRLLLHLLQKTHFSLLYPPRMLPSRPLPPFSPPPCAASSTRWAVRWNGRVWRVTWPGPVMWTRKRPSPP